MNCFNQLRIQKGHAASALTGRQGVGVVFFPSGKISTPVRRAPTGRPRPPLTALVHGPYPSGRRTQPASAVGPSSLQSGPWTRTCGGRIGYYPTPFWGEDWPSPQAPQPASRPNLLTYPYPWDVSLATDFVIRGGGSVRTTPCNAVCGCRGMVR